MTPTSTAADVIEGVELSGQVAVITGASGGIGLETARALASAGATVVLANRASAKSDAAAAALRATMPDTVIELGELDLTSLAGVREFATWAGGRHERIHVLVNNAGVMATPFGRTADGFEQQFGINHLGHFLLTNLLMPRLLDAAPARVVTVSSHGHQLAGIDWDDPNYRRRDYEPWRAYGQSKSANLLFTLELERRFGPHGVHAFAVHPGLVATDLGRNLADDDRARFEQRMTQPGNLTKTAAQGAATSVFAAMSAELIDHGGSYLEDCHLSDAVAAHAADVADASRLWALSEELVGETFPAPEPIEGA